MSDDTIPRHLRVALATATRAFQSGDFAVFGTFNEDLQPVVDAAMAQIRSRDATIGALRADAENMLWNLGGVSSVCMGALDADFTFDESSARAALHDAVKLRKERNAYRSALVDIARHVASPGAEDLADKLDVEDLPTLVECVTGCYTPKAGAEAEDLRRCMERYTDGPIADEMRAILDEVDARDSLAYLTEQDKPRIDVIGQLRERVAELEAALDDGISIVMDFAPGHDGWLDNAARLLENTIEAADAAKGRG